MFSMFPICCWYNKVHDDQNKVENIAISCINCGKETMISVDNMNTAYHDIITLFVLNTVLYRVVMLWIIETHEQLKYYIDKYNSDWMKFGPRYNTYICKKIHGNVFE